MWHNFFVLSLLYKNRYTCNLCSVMLWKHSWHLETSKRIIIMLKCTQSNNGYFQTINLLLLGCFFIFTITQILRFRRKQKKNYLLFAYKKWNTCMACNKCMCYNECIIKNVQIIRNSINTRTLPIYENVIPYVRNYKIPIHLMARKATFRLLGLV